MGIHMWISIYGYPYGHSYTHGNPAVITVQFRLFRNIFIKLFVISKMASIDKPKIYYFDGKGRAEVSRLVFVLTGNEFEDVRFNSEEWTNKFKAESPLGTAPFYEEGDVKIGGSLGIVRYVSDKHGLGGANPFESAFLESLSDAMFDLGTKLYPFMFGPEGEREEAKKSFLETIPVKLNYLERLVKGEDTFLDGKQSYPDLHISAFHMDCTKFQVTDVFEDCPKLQKVIGRIDSNVNVMAFREKHP